MLHATYGACHPTPFPSTTLGTPANPLANLLLSLYTHTDSRRTPNLPSRPRRFLRPARLDLLLNAKALVLPLPHLDRARAAQCVQPAVRAEGEEAGG